MFMFLCRYVASVNQALGFPLLLSMHHFLALWEPCRRCAGWQISFGCRSSARCTSECSQVQPMFESVVVNPIWRQKGCGSLFDPWKMYRRALCFLLSIRVLGKFYLASDKDLAKSRVFNVRRHRSNKKHVCSNSSCWPHRIEYPRRV